MAALGGKMESEEDTSNYRGEDVLPVWLEWGLTAIIGVSMALIAFILAWSDFLITVPKLRFADQLIQDGNLFKGVAFLMFIGIIGVGSAAAIVVFVAPGCAGSGLPEIKGYLNGNFIAEPGSNRPYFGTRKSLLRAAGAVLVTGGGLCTGREGPLVSVGGSVGLLILQRLAGHHFRQRIKLSAEEDNQEALVENEQRFSYAKRMHCVMGAAAGLSAAFHSPLGGLLYMFEEATVTCWSPEMTFKTALVTGFGALAARLIHNLSGADIHQLVMFRTVGYNYHEEREWFWGDIPFMAFNAVMCGAVAATYSFCAFQMFKLRKSCWGGRVPNKPWAKIVEACAWAAFTALVIGLVPLLSTCIPDPVPAVDPAFHHDVHAEDVHAEQTRWRRYNCPQGHHNPLATILFQGGEGAIKTFFDRTEEGILQLAPLLMAFMVYFPLSVGVAGLATPCGNFIPSMFMGAALGRSLRVALGLLHLPFELADPGVYALLGSGAVLGGFMHMTVAIATMLVESSFDIKIAAPLLLSVLIGRMVSRVFLPKDHSEMLMELKGVPFLSRECPKKHEDMTVGQVCEPVPESAMLPQEASVEELIEALDSSPTLEYFPIIVEGTVHIAGLVPRRRLQGAVEVAQAVVNHQTFAPGASPAARPADDFAFRRRPEPVEQEVQSYQTPRGLLSFMNRICGQQVAPSTWCSWDASPTVMDRIKPSDVPPRAGLDPAYDVDIGFQDTETGSTVSRGSFRVQVSRLADPVPYSVMEDAPLSRVYRLFSQAGVDAMVITPKWEALLEEHNRRVRQQEIEGEDPTILPAIVGVLSRRNLTKVELGAPQPAVLQASRSGLGEKK